MFRTTLKPNAGMLFVFKHKTHTGFWMKNTHIPLSIGFFNTDKSLMETQSMTPQSLKQHRPKNRYAYALEVNQGWFAKHAIKKAIALH